MECPKCEGRLNRKGIMIMKALVEVDLCVKCGGIWLDKGELETLMLMSEVLGKQGFVEE